MTRADQTGEGQMRLPVHHVECLLMAILAVNTYSLEKVWALLPRMRQLGLTDPKRVATMDMTAAISVLATAGYDRGKLTWMFAERVKALMVALGSGALDGLGEAVRARDKTAAVKLLTGIRGIGPRVIENAWTLLTS